MLPCGFASKGIKMTENELSIEALEHLIAFFHLEKNIYHAPNPNAYFAHAHEFFNTSQTTYACVKKKIKDKINAVCEQLLCEQHFKQQVLELPFSKDSKIIALGDSYTDYALSWFNLLAHCCHLCRQQDNIEFINLAVSGHTSTNVLSTLIQTVKYQPQFTFCLCGTNDARRNGRGIDKVLVSIDETRKNYHAIQSFMSQRTDSRMIWLTPCRIIEEKILHDPLLSTFELSWKNRDLDACSTAVKNLGQPYIDLNCIFGAQPPADLFLADGLHPNIDGQCAILKEVLSYLA